jgi:hypothetical protein
MKNIFSTFLIIAVVVVGTSTEAQQPGKVPRIGYLSSSDPATESNRADRVVR